jgi:hypothetical protein
MDAADVFTFTGADVQGKNIRLEAASELERRTDVRVGKAVENAQAGVGGAQDVAAAQKTAPNAVAKQTADLAVRTYLAAGDVDINVKDHSIPALRQSIDRAKSRAIAQGRKGDFVDLVLLENLITEQIEGTEPDNGDAAPTMPEEQSTQPEG